MLLHVAMLVVSPIWNFIVSPFSGAVREEKYYCYLPKSQAWPGVKLVRRCAVVLKMDKDPHCSVVGVVYVRPCIIRFRSVSRRAAVSSVPEIPIPCAGICALEWSTYLTLLSYQ